MARFSKRILTLATYSLLVTFLSLIICFLSNEESTAQVIFSGVSLYGTIITIYILMLHLLFVFISFIIKIIKQQDNK